MDRIPRSNVVHKLEKRGLLIAINCIAGLSIFFFGYDQGMMGGVNGALDYYQTTMKFGHEGPNGAPIIDNTLLQGGIVSIYYLGTLMGCLVGGSFGDRYGRIKTIALGAGWAVIGASLQTSAQNHAWMICGMFFIIYHEVTRADNDHSSSHQRMGYGDPQRYRSRLGHRDRRAQVAWTIRRH